MIKLKSLHNITKEVKELSVTYDIWGSQWAFQNDVLVEIGKEWEKYNSDPLGEVESSRFGKGLYASQPARTLTGEFVSKESLDVWMEFVESKLNEEETFLDLDKQDAEKKEKEKEEEVQKLNASIEARKIANKVLKKNAK